MPDTDRTHCTVSLLLLAVCGMLCAAMDVAARSQRLAIWLDDRAAVEYERQNRAFLRTRNYGDFFETLMLDELPHADYSRGGAYVMGSSNVVFCAEFGDLPTEPRKLIHNYGFPGADALEMLQFVQYLTDHEGWLRAGGDKTAVLIGLNYKDMLDTTAQFGGAGDFFPAYLNGSGLFQYDPKQGVSLPPMSPWERSLLIRRNQWRSFAIRLERSITPVKNLQANAAAIHAAAERASKIGESLETSSQWAQLQRLLDYLKARHMRASLLIMPTGTWFDGIPAEQIFITRLPRMAAANGVPLIDLTHLLSDDEFMDDRHATFAGAKKVHQALLKWAFNQLHQTGALPAGVTP